MLVAGREPKRKILNVPLHVFQLARLTLDAIAWPLGDESRAAAVDVPVVVHEVMKAGCGDGTAEIVSVFVLSSLKSHDQVERESRHLARAGRNNASIGL